MSVQMNADAFLRRTASIFLMLVGLVLAYGLYAIATAYPEGTPWLGRLVALARALGVVFALLAPLAVFGGALDRFDAFGESAPGVRRRQWLWLICVAVATGLVAGFAPVLGDRVLATIADDPTAVPLAAPTPASDYVRLLAPFALAIFVALSALAGAVVGRQTERMSPAAGRSWRWLACVVLFALFCVPVVALAELVVVHGFPAVLIAVVPPAVPFAATYVMLRIQHYDLRDVLGLPRPGQLDSEAIERLAAAVVAADEEGHDGRIVATARNEEELRTARFMLRLQRAAAPTLTVSPASARRIVNSALAAAPAPQEAEPPWLRPHFERAMPLAISWAALTLCLLFSGGMIGGAVGRDSLIVAAAVGLLGAVVSGHLPSAHPGRGSTGAAPARA